MSKTKKIPAKKGRLKFTLIAPTDYGAYHNTGFKQTNPKQWFYGLNTGIPFEFIQLLGINRCKEYVFSFFFL